MKYFYKIENGQLKRGSGKVIPTGFTEYIKGQEPDELLNYLNEENLIKIKKQIELRATNFVKKQLSELDYDNEGEVALYATNSDSSWHDEAVALQKWIEEVYVKMYELEESVTIDNYKDIDLDKIEAEYPAFEFEGAE